MRKARAKVKAKFEPQNCRRKLGEPDCRCNACAGDTGIVREVPRSRVRTRDRRSRITTRGSTTGRPPDSGR